MNFYKRYMGDFARDTAHLTMLQRGAYNDMLDYYYATGRSLPADSDQLYRIARAMTPAERKAVDSVASEFFPVNGDGTRHNKRADSEMEKHGRQVTINREQGKKGGRPKKTDSVSEHETDSVSIPEPNDNPNQIPDTRTPLSPLTGACPRFEDFWLAWPRNERKQAKGDCLALWKKLKCERDAAAVIAHVEGMRRTRSWLEGYVPAPKIYLKERRWEGAELDSAEVKVDL